MGNVYTTPKMAWSIKINEKEPGVDPKISFKANFNSIKITHKCTNQSINNYQVWVTFYKFVAESVDKFPATGVVGNYYYASNTGKYYKWEDGAYVEKAWVEPESGLNVGTKAYENTGNLAANVERVAAITASNTIFNKGDGTYKMCLCARGDIDMTWDITEILIDVQLKVFQPTNADAVEVLFQGSK